MVGARQVSTGVVPGSRSLNSPPSRLHLLGRVTFPYASAVSPLGPDGTCDQFWTAASGWALTNVTDSGVQNTNVLASCCYDPTSGRVYMFGDWDGGNASPGQSKYYDTATQHYTAITALPSAGGEGGNDTYAAVFGSTCFIFGGMVNGATGFSAKILSYPINIGTPSQAFTTTSAVVAYAAKDMFGAVDSANSNICYFGGGNSDTLDPPTNSTTNHSGWFKYDMSTPNTNPVAMTSMTDARAMAGCVDIGSEILVIGGSLDGTPNTVGTTVVRAYSKAGNSWRTLSTAYPVAVASARAVFYKGVIYCAGGFDSTGFNISTDPPNSVTSVYKSSDLGVTWQLHSSLSDVNYVSAPAGQRGAKASGGSILVAQ